MFALLLAVVVGFQTVPPPELCPVDVVVSGRTSTLKSISIKDVGTSIPETFSGNRIKNTPNFLWYVSRHYALQTDYPTPRAHLLLTLLELAYPHYLALFGEEPQGISHRRMAVVYGAGKESLKTVLDADGIAWDFGGGGITFEGINAAFNYPSGTLQYHQRYIMLHECTHLFQICLHGTTRNTPSWFYEGVADALSHHVWESERQRLTLYVVDKPTINNWYDAALEEYAKQPFKASDILSGRRGGRPLGFILYTYFDTDLSRRERFRIWRDELIRLNLVNSFQAASDKLIGELFGAAKLDSDFDAWIRARHSSFHYVDWGWEQDGDAMMSYGFAANNAFSQTNLNFLPKDVAVYDPLVMDYPLHPQSELVEPVKRGVVPTVGCLVDFRETPDSGVAGIGLGVQGISMLQVLVVKHTRLLIDTSGVGGGSQGIDFPPAFLAAMGNSYKVGLTVKLTGSTVEVVAQAGAGSGVTQLHMTVQADEVLLNRLKSNPMAVISRGGRHWITPYVDDARKPEPDLDTPAPPNRWRFADEARLYALFRAGWQLGDEAPSSIRDAEDSLISTANGRSTEQLATDDLMRKVAEDIRSCHAAPGAITAALAELKSK